MEEKYTRPLGIDLFAGAGGMSLGFEQAGFDIAAAVEIDPIHCATHEFNFPDSKTICASVVDLKGSKIRQLANIGSKEIDVVFGGAPCQGFSMIGKRALDDSRNQLVFHYVRLVRELTPKYCVFENVKGLTVGKHAKFLQELIEALQESGYDILLPYKVLNAADYGVPQQRHRLFLIGARRGEPLPKYPEKNPKHVTVWNAIGDLPNADDFQELEKNDSVNVLWNTTHTYARKLRGLNVDPTDFGYKRMFDNCNLSSSRKTKHTSLSKERFLATKQGETEPISRFHKLDPAGLCNTLRAGTDSARGAFTSPRPIHPYQPRVITVREAARLHSYPDWFRFHITKWHGFRQVGNSVPPLLARAVASELIKTMGIEPHKPPHVLYPQNTELLSFDMKTAAGFYNVPHDTIAQRTRKDSSSKNQIQLQLG
ncbi:MAG: DNA cytosine methyltransferase [Pontiellaceae bacterium]|nr:DNA cytosine methyltransferase [Pontiellaceae bacterium]